MHVFVWLYVDHVRNFAHDYIEKKMMDWERERIIYIYMRAGLLE